MDKLPISQNSFSWSILSAEIFEKNTDKTTFINNETRVPRNLTYIFEANELQRREKKYIRLIFQGEIYLAHIESDNQVPPRTDLKWGSEFGNLLRVEFPGWYERFLKNKKQKDVPIIRFQKINHENFIVSFIHESKLDSLNEFEETYIPQKEGSIIYYCSKRLERSELNRNQAIKIHGKKCLCCGFDFELIYGKRGSDFIEIHHIKPLGKFKQEEIVNPVTDLFPLCSNCHRMIHTEKNDVISIEELRGLIKFEYLNFVRSMSD